MPIYDYACSNCGRVIEVIHGINEGGPRFCPQCGAEGTMRKAMTTPSIVFKGSGWAKVDRRASSGRSSSSGGSKPATSDGEGGSKTSTSETAGSGTGTGSGDGSGDGGSAAASSGDASSTASSGGSAGSSSGRSSGQKGDD